MYSVATMDLFVGTSGYSYKAWKGSFYPEDLAAKDMLRHYGGKLSAVEINNTFYRLPRVSVLDNWAEQVPEAFRFAIKASQRITHRKRLKQAGDETGYLLETTATLDRRLGAILFQLPPNFRLDLERLDAFLALLPEGARATFEFRHASWFDEELYARLRERNFPLCIADNDGDDEAATIVSTADWGYLRLRRADYPTAALRDWADRIGEQGWQQVYTFFKHEDGGTGPRLAGRFREMLEAV